jgi:hypothetical protein
VNAVRKKINLERLAKVLALTGSHYDNEALTAARTASGLLSQANLTYQELFHDYIPSASRDEKLSNLEHRYLEARAKIAELRQEVSSLRAGQSQAPSLAQGEVRRWHRKLLEEMPLLSSERRALTEIKAIGHKSKEEFYVRWLARRYQLTE